ncbi:hypothetical protein D0962_19480 [Leptolyngbyaceae cyanobacterium CCMR0082]|uniref:Uncharacterized protein n=1 Tax=Adonisia turfae CCMR0082 TaxID=2304604 RepID=A0A6M0SAD1_9CYAN|nr:hypothetical protein [Adonisia turfae]NEZ64941.1 hypothetical protein [Adonisia turfae CCMR0082]
MKNRLLTLEHNLCSSSDKPKKYRRKRYHGPPKQQSHQVYTQAQSFDWDEPIELTYNSESNSYIANTAYAAAYGDEDYGEDDRAANAFSMDDGYDEDDHVATTFEWREDKDDEGAYSVSIFGIDDDYDEDDHAASSFKWNDNRRTSAFEVESFDLEDGEQDDQQGTIGQSFGQPFSVADLDEDTLAEDLDFSDLDTASEKAQSDQAMSDRAFAADLQAILSGKKTYDQDRSDRVKANKDAHQLSTAASTETTSALPDDIREAVADPHDVFDQMSSHMPHNQMDDTPVIPVSSQPVEVKEDMTGSRAHDVFDRMGHNMSHATSFNLGTISLEQRFDEFDQELQQTTEKQNQPHRARAENRPTSPDHSASLTLDETALAADLAQMQSLSETEGRVEMSEQEQQEHEAEMPQETETRESNEVIENV